MSRNWKLITSLGAALLAAAGVVAAEDTRPTEEPAALEFFERKIRPLLVDNCYNCHSANTNAKGGLRVDDRKGLLDGGASGSAVVPGDPDSSLLIKAVRYADVDLQMPPKKQLTEEQIADLTKWVKDGAAWPKTEIAYEVGKPNEKYDRLKKSHWAWQPLVDGKPPDIRGTDWPRDAIDRFVLAKLEAANLAPVGDADRIALIRRVTFDLTGLPPTVSDVDAFIADTSVNAYEKVVDRLLASPAYGERWGRHWLDVARYGESTGSSRNVPYPHAWRYRDYVINSFNADKPYDQFIREQIAGDLLPATSEQQREEQTVATGFLALGVKDVNQRFKVRFTMDNIDEQIDTITRSVLAVTASCARCHDHKFDPIPATDYYALAGIFHSTDLCAGVRNKMGGGGLDYYDTSMLLSTGPAVAPDAEKLAEIETLRKKVEEAKSNFQALKGSPEGEELAPNGKPKRQVARQKMNKLQQELNALSDPSVSGKVALGAREAKTIGDTELRIRGEAEKLGPVVQRGFLSLIEVPGAAAINAQQSGRLELAQWLTSEKNPLTARVIANRVWQHLLGQGIVTSVDNFGVTGDSPSHPELLDHLSQRLIRSGWSIKQLVRTIALSRTYQLGSETSDSHFGIDPANRLLWRHSHRRLDAEEIRDATLAAAGRLSLSRPEASPAQKLKVTEIRNNGAEAKKINEAARSSVGRSIYLPLLRDLTPTSLEVFDFAEQGMVTGSRETTTVATQALYLLNDPFVRRQALALADELLAKADEEDSRRITEAYRRTLGRLPSREELQRAFAYLADYEATVGEQAAAASAAQVATATPAAKDAETEATTVKMPIIDPDQVVLADVPVSEEVVAAQNARAAAWASLCQALLGSAEFRYLK
jgi:mono/diheme cytochrome c family protein